MEWTASFREEMKQRHLRQIEIYLVAWTMNVSVLIFVYFLLRYRIGRLSFFRYAAPIFSIYVYAYLAVFYVLLKKNLWVRATSSLILVFDAIFITLISYFLGAPLFYLVVVYPLFIAIYSIYIHPTMASRFFILAMILLGVTTMLNLLEFIPFFPVMQLDPNPSHYSLIYDIFVKSYQSRFYMGLGYGIIILVSFTTLVIVNFIVKNLRQREKELADSYKKISRLSEKLKVYLPRQFVESLTRGERDTFPDYRRRRLTIFFSDVQGFTNWTDKLEPEDVRELLNQYLSEMSKIANKWGGTVDKFIGDAIMVFFGDPEFTNDKDHATRCVKMAMEMQEKMFSLRRQWEEFGHLDSLHIRIGINTGYATVGNFGSEDRLNYTALGSAVNVAARLESACEPDKIMVSYSTYALIKDEIECAPRGEVELKGFAKPIKVYEVIGVKNAEKG